MINVVNVKKLKSILSVKVEEAKKSQHGGKRIAAVTKNRGRVNNFIASILRGQLKRWERPDQMEIDQMVRCPHNTCCPPENENYGVVFTDHSIRDEKSKIAVQEFMMNSLMHNQPCMSLISEEKGHHLGNPDREFTDADGAVPGGQR